MKNYIQDDDNIALTAPYAVSAGDGFQVGTFFAVAIDSAANGAPVVGVLEGVFELKAATADTPAQGAKVYWDNAAKQVTTTVGANMLIGAAVVTKASGAPKCTVRLNGIAV
jgi:predicted RecA/RadA family phage recombinase